MNGVSAFGRESGAYQSGWDDGYASGLRQAASSDRAAAFGAIRRAVTVARRYDKDARDHRDIVRRMIANDPACAHRDHSPTCDRHRRSARTHEERAASIRFAVRSAIQSPWLMIEPGMSRRDP